MRTMPKQQPPACGYSGGKVVDDVLRRTHDDMVNHLDVIRPVHPADLSLAAELTNGVKIDLHAPLLPQDE